MKKKTVFISITQGVAVRNIFFNDFFKLLKEKYTVILFSPLYKDENFIKKFPDIKILELKSGKKNFLQKKILNFISGLNRSLMYNPTVEVYTKTGFFLTDKKVVKTKIILLFRKFLFGKILNKFMFLRKFILSIDRFIFNTNYYDKLIDHYNPELVFITSINIESEILFLRNCKKRNIKSMAMVRSWDNLSKSGLREKADKLMVWSEYMKNEAINFQMYKENEIEVIGVPQFDYYKKLEIPNKDEFYKKYDLNPEKKNIFFGSSGPFSLADPYIAKIIIDFIKDGSLSSYQLIIRPHFMYKGDAERFTHLEEKNFCYLDKFYEYSNFNDNVELSLENIKNLACIIKYSSVTICAASTLILDAIANNKNSILFDFDEEKELPFNRSTKRFFHSLWMREINAIGLDNIAHDEKELLNKILEIEKNPLKNDTLRKKISEKFCYKLDGKSGIRLFNVIDRF